MRDNEITASNSTGNQLLDGLPFEERDLLSSRCSLLTLDAGKIIAEPNKPIPHVYFPRTASISVFATDSSSHCIEGMLIGNEGMFGLPVALGTDMWPLRARVQCAGQALRVPADEFRDVYTRSPSLRRTLMRYSLTTLSQLARSIVCTSFHSIESRLGRWMLMTQDRTCSDTFNITHELLSEILGVRRAGISVAAASLKARGLIRYRNGRITITDRSGLETASCDCYEAARTIYRANLHVLPVHPQPTG